MKKNTTFWDKQSLWAITINILCAFFLVCMITSPARFISKGLDGISAWAFNVLPSVLPFMFFTRILSSFNTLEKLSRPLSGITKKCFNTPPVSLYAFLMAVLSGYPVGSKLVADLYLQGKISRTDAIRMSSFCSTSGPMFIVGAVGVGMFASAKIGYILFASHFLGAIINGVMFRKLKVKESDNVSPQISEQKQFDLSDVVLSCTQAILSVGCIIMIFFIVIECLSPILALLPQNACYFFEGIIEITKGCLDLSTLQNGKLAVILTSFVISFGGISTLLQSLTMLHKVKMPVALFALQKLCHAVFSCLVTILLVTFFGI